MGTLCEIRNGGRTASWVGAAVALVIAVAAVSRADESAASTVVRAAAANPKPVIVYLAGPSPSQLALRTVVYDNGLVIYDDDAVRQDHSRESYGDVFRVSPVFHSVVLSPTDCQQLIDRIHPDDLATLKPDYQMEYPWYYAVVTWPNGVEHEVQVGGFIYSEGTDPDSEHMIVDITHRTGDTQTVARELVPDRLLRATDTLQYFVSNRAVDFPDTAYSYDFDPAGSKAHGRPWPSSFPSVAMGPSNEGPVATSEVDAQSYRALTDTEWKASSDLFEIDGSTWHVVALATAFLPNSHMWAHALRPASGDSSNSN